MLRDDEEQEPEQQESPTTAKPSSGSKARATARKGGMVIDDQHGPGHRLMVGRTKRAHIGAIPGSDLQPTEGSAL
jgi:hypothetical protein